MKQTGLVLAADPQSGGAIISDGRDRSQVLHPLWLRERATEPDSLDPVSNQRLYEPNDLPADLRIVSVEQNGAGEALIRFDDNYEERLNIERLAIECDWLRDPNHFPPAKAWTASQIQTPEVDYADIATAAGMERLLDGFFSNGFCIIRETPHKPGDLAALAENFGYIRETNFGKLFNVIVKRDATDIAYTNRALAAHTDNPYRFPVPGIQFLHCLENNVSGGHSTVVDGLALVERLEQIAPEEARALERLPVAFRYETKSCIVEDVSPLIERDGLGQLIGLRLSSRLDYVRPADPAELELFYSGRRRLQKMATNPEFVFSFPFEPGLLLMMDNRRTLHGRTAYDDAKGHRHLQGCYIDHDGPRSLYHTLMRDGAATLGREEP